MSEQKEFKCIICGNETKWNDKSIRDLPLECCDNTMRDVTVRNEERRTTMQRHLDDADREFIPYC